jgi:polysaccharide export outer membrane protein
MKNFLIITILILFLPSISLAQNNGFISKSSDNTSKAVINVINAPYDVPVTHDTPVVPAKTADTDEPAEYTVGIDDVLDVHVLKPEILYISATVSPDGTIVIPYIGSVRVRNHTIAQIQDEVQSRLANGYMKYPVVSVSLTETNSRRFFVYGEVVKPGSYNLEENMSVLRAISMAGGFTQFGSSSRVKILRPKKSTSGYDVIKVNITDVMNGVPNSDPPISQGDIIVVSEGIF